MNSPSVGIDNELVVTTSGQHGAGSVSNTALPLVLINGEPAKKAVTRVLEALIRRIYRGGDHRMRRSATGGPHLHVLVSFAICSVWIRSSPLIRCPEHFDWRFL